MKVTATTVSYDGIPRVVMLEFAGVDCDPGRYVMKPDDWETLQPIYLDRPDVILELVYRDATLDEIDQVKEVAEQINRLALGGGTESSIE